MLATFQLGEVLLSIMWFFLFFIWIIILFQVVVDLFRSHDLGGWGKALWLAFIIFLPYLGVFVYLIARGKGMGERHLADAARSQAQFKEYVQSAAGSSASAADEIAKLAALRDSGTIDEAEFQSAKAKLLT
ncbi:MAG TPA: SHOCT domain-containing protein [Microthrixaceae bacterium]|nr:SHOCT domain-containing protein [Microthrixaceae bacterium]